MKGECSPWSLRFFAVLVNVDLSTEIGEMVQIAERLRRVWKAVGDYTQLAGRPQGVDGE